jgi:excisionase family DNA binding protein
VPDVKPDDYWMSSVMVAATLGISRSQVNRLAAAGELEAEKLGGTVWMFRSSVVEAYARQRAS